MISGERIAEIAARLVALPSVVGVVVGGSRARGDHLPTSDVDLGVYYEGTIDTAGLADLAQSLTGSPVPVAGPGEWGPWVNGGAWLSVDGTAVDWILRDLSRVREQVERAHRGEFGFHAQAGHPLGFLDISYAGELATAQILTDPSGVLGRLHATLEKFPPPLREAMVEALWEADFLLDAAGKGAERADTTYVSTCLSRAVLLAAHAVCARAGTWVTNEKGLVALAGSRPGAPEGFTQRVSAALGRAGTTTEDLRTAIRAVRELLTDVRAANSRHEDATP